VNALADAASERLLIEAAQQDPSQFAALYQANFNRVYAYVARRVKDRAEAEDVTAEVFHTALVNLRRFQWRGVPFSAWLLRIAANALADRWKKQSAGKDIPADEGGEEIPGNDPQVERNAMLFQLVERSPEDQRLVIFRRFVEQRSVREIAQELGRSDGAIKQLQFRALENLRSQMKERP